MISVSVTEASQVSDVRRRLVALCQRLGFDETAAGRAAIVVTELATNLVKYGQAGEVLLGTYDDRSGHGVEVIALDKGPGLDIGGSLRDGHSTGGSAGTGLGAARRQSDVFDIVSWANSGTGVLARIDAAKPSSDRGTDHGGVAVPMRGEAVCGDAYTFAVFPDGWTVMVADGLGHGANAAAASEEALRLFRTAEDAPPKDILAIVHAGLRHTRGGAVSVARYDGRDEIEFAGIGNVVGAVVTAGGIKRTVSMPGTAGHVARRIQSFLYPCPPGSAFVMCSDGIGTNWSLDQHPGLLDLHPSLAASVIYRDFARGRDDATVVMARSVPA